MRCLNVGRVIWAAYAVGAAEHLIEMAAHHLTTRRQFGRPLADNQGLQWQLADMAADLHAARLVAHDAGWRYDREPERYSKDLPIERIWRDIRVIRILVGTSEILRTIVARHVLASGAG